MSQDSELSDRSRVSLLYFLFYSDVHSPRPSPFVLSHLSDIIRLHSTILSGVFSAGFWTSARFSACVCDVLWFLADWVLTLCQPQHPVSLVTLCRRKRLSSSAAPCWRLHLGPTAQVSRTSAGTGSACREFGNSSRPLRVLLLPQ